MHLPRLTHLRYALLVLPLSAATILAQAPPPPGVVRPPLIPASPMMVLQQMFKECKPPRPKDLPGDWMLIRHIMTAKFLKQPNGRDHQTFNIQGIRRDKNPGTPLEWTMSIGAAKNGRLRVTSHTQWEPTGDVSPLTFNSAGDMLFTKDYGHDSKWVYRCRAGSPTRLVCLLKDHEAGHGLEFTKMPPPSAAKPASAPAH